MIVAASTVAVVAPGHDFQPSVFDFVTQVG
jgi:hypothetical protein